MTLVRYEPFRLFGRFNNDINRLLSGTMAQDEPRQSGGWLPAVDIREEDERFVLYADIPGVAREAIDISLENDVLTIKGERSIDDTAAAEGIRRRERGQGAFLRRFTLPDTVNTDSITAAMKDGVLRIEIPKQAKPLARRITVS